MQAILRILAVDFQTVSSTVNWSHSSTKWKRRSYRISSSGGTGACCSLDSFSNADYPVNREIFPDITAECDEPKKDSIVARMRNQAQKRRLTEERRRLAEDQGGEEQQVNPTATEATDNEWDNIDPELRGFDEDNGR